MNEHMEAAVKAGAFSINPYPYQGEFAAIGHIHIAHGETWDEAVQREKRSAEYKAHEVITAALPHIRAMIAEEAANSWIPHRDELAQAIASGYEPDHPVPNRHDYKATDSVLRLLTAAQIAEGNRP